MTEPIHEISVEGFIESFDRRYPTFILKTLLCDRTTGRNIIWADNEYEALGDGCMGDDEITVEKITGMNSGVIKPRIAKEQEKQSQRAKNRLRVTSLRIPFAARRSRLGHCLPLKTCTAYRPPIFPLNFFRSTEAETFVGTASSTRGSYALTQAPRSGYVPLAWHVQSFVGTGCPKTSLSAAFCISTH